MSVCISIKQNAKKIGGKCTAPLLRSHDSNNCSQYFIIFIVTDTNPLIDMEHNLRPVSPATVDIDATVDLCTEHQSQKHLFDDEAESFFEMTSSRLKAKKARKETGPYSCDLFGSQEVVKDENKKIDSLLPHGEDNETFVASLLRHESQRFNRGSSQVNTEGSSQEVTEIGPTQISSRDHSQAGTSDASSNHQPSQPDDTQDPPCKKLLMKAFVSNFHAKMEEVLREWSPDYSPTQAEIDMELGTICTEILQVLAGRCFSDSKWAKNVLLTELAKRTQKKYHH